MKAYRFGGTWEFRVRPGYKVVVTSSADGGVTARLTHACDPLWYLEVRGVDEIHALCLLTHAHSRDLAASVDTRGG